MTNRHLDVSAPPHHEELPHLAAIDWKRVDAVAPEPISFDYGGPDAPLPSADILIITWTSAEWSALDHVFANSRTERSRYARAWEREWHRYALDAPSGGLSSAWGMYRLVSVKARNGKSFVVMLYKSDTHLAHPPWISGLTAMTERILDEVKPSVLYSIGTAGGSTDADLLGDSVITNAGHIELRDEKNRDVGYNEATVTGSWFPEMSSVPDVADHLLLPLDRVVDHAELEYLLWRLHQRNSESASFGLSDLLNAPLDPRNLNRPQGLDRRDRPLLTTDYYYISPGQSGSPYCALEMDDTVLAHIAKGRGVKFAFVRNISDPVVPAQTGDGRPIPQEVREDWSSLIYENFGLYTSTNGALVTWALIAGATS